MLKAFVEKIAELASIETFEIGDQAYSTKPLHYVSPHKDRPSAIDLKGLEGAVAAIRREIDIVGNPILIRINSHSYVDVLTSYHEDYTRSTLYEIRSDVGGFREGIRAHSEAIIELRSRFIPNEGTAYMLDLLSRMNIGNSVETTDNGITQNVTARAGVALNTMVQVKPIVKLAPYRTFMEIEQPESEFLLRVEGDGSVGLYEADGGMWKLEAKRRIAAYFREQLADLIETGEVTVLV